MTTGVQSKIPVVAEHVLIELENRLLNATNKQFTDEDLLSLHSVFGSVFQRALDILEKQPNLTQYTTNKNCRSLIEIKGENGRCYRVFPKINYCPCQAFAHHVLEKKTEIVCKHVLSARLAQILGRTVTHEVTADQYLMLVRSMFHFDVQDG